LKKIILAAIAVLISILIFEGCVYNKGDENYPPRPGGGDCDVSNVRYSVEIKAILDANCQFCHKGPGSVSGRDLYDYSIISTLALDGQFTYGTLISAVLQKGGAPFMPQSSPQEQLNDCDLNKIITWVHNGAPNN
jgi:hypothetical protein